MQPFCYTCDTLLLPLREYGPGGIRRLRPSVGLAPALLPAGHPVRCFRAETSRCQAAPIADAPGHPAPPAVPRDEGLFPGRRGSAASALVGVGPAFLRRLDPLIVDLHRSRSPGRESNPQPAVYKTAALPLSHRSTLREKREGACSRQDEGLCIGDHLAADPDEDRISEFLRDGTGRPLCDAADGAVHRLEDPICEGLLPGRVHGPARAAVSVPPARTRAGGGSPPAAAASLLSPARVLPGAPLPGHVPGPSPPLPHRAGGVPAGGR